MENKGYVYVLTNPCFKENWVKIGMTDNLERRIFELSQATGVPLPFEKFAVLKTSKYKKAEILIHHLIGKLAPSMRINPKREFFNIEPDDAVAIMKEIAEVIDDAEIIYFNNIDKQNKVKDKKAQIKTFYSMGLKDGDVVSFTLDTNYKATVCGERTLMFENKEYFTTTLARILALKIGKNEQDARNIACGGFGCFKYDDEDKHLYERYERYKKLNGKVT